MYLVARFGVLSSLVYFGGLWLLHLVYLLAKFGILAAWIWGTWCTWWPEFGILRCFNVMYFVALYLVAVLSDKKRLPGTLRVINMVDNILGLQIPRLQLLRVLDVWYFVY